MDYFSGLPKTLGAALASKGYSEPTPVQTAVTEPDVAGLDLLVSAQTGSGKTVGFGLALAQDILDAEGRFDRPAAPLALVIAPTRELAMQVRREFDWLFAEAGIVTASSVGGMDTRTERRAFERGCHVVVATPGRLRDHVARGGVDLSNLRAVVLDEADEMLDMGFAEDLEFILDHTPEDRRTLLFSATVPRGIAKLAQTYQKDDARRIEVGSGESQHADISYMALNVAPSDIEKAIINLLRYHEARTAIIFANTRAMVARLTAKFSNRGFSVVSLSGELSQTERTHALQSLRDGRARVCIATDVAARGIDLPGLELVIHADLPSNSETLLHRSGRTGRAGRKGTSVLIVPARQRSKAQRLLKTAKLTADWTVPPSAEDVLARDEERILADAGWNDPLSPEETAFAEKLLEARSPEQIAAAFFRLYRERNAPPEDLTAAPEPGERKKRDHQDFGPSTWFSVSLGRKDRAEPRWLLPMLCRNTGLPKSSIGAIRVQYQETFIEILSASIPAMKAELGSDMEIEQGARLTELTGVPDFDASPKGPPSAPRGPDHRPFKGGKRDNGRPDGQDNRPARTKPAKPKKDWASRQEDSSDAAPARADTYKRTEDGPRDKKPRAKAGGPFKGGPNKAGQKYGKSKDGPSKEGHGKDGKPRAFQSKAGQSKPGQSRPGQSKSGPPKKGAPKWKSAKPFAGQDADSKERKKPGGETPSHKRHKPRTGKGPDARPKRQPARKG